jgi:hypothetical protein
MTVLWQARIFFIYVKCVCISSLVVLGFLVIIQRRFLIGVEGIFKNERMLLHRGFLD